MFETLASAPAIYLIKILLDPVIIHDLVFGPIHILLVSVAKDGMAHFLTAIFDVPVVTANPALDSRATYPVLVHLYMLSDPVTL